MSNAVDPTPRSPALPAGAVDARLGGRRGQPVLGLPCTSMDVRADFVAGER